MKKPFTLYAQQTFVTRRESTPQKKNKKFISIFVNTKCTLKRTTYIFFFKMGIQITLGCIEFTGLAAKKYVVRVTIS